MRLHGPLCLFPSACGSNVLKLPVYLSVSPTSLKLLEDKSCVWLTVHILCVPTHPRHIEVLRLTLCPTLLGPEM